MLNNKSLWSLTGLLYKDHNRFLIPETIHNLYYYIHISSSERFEANQVCERSSHTVRIHIYSHEIIYDYVL